MNRFARHISGMSRGIGLVEFAGLAVILSTLVVLGLGLLDFAQRKIILESELENQLKSTQVAGLLATLRSGRANVVVDSLGLRDLVDREVEELRVKVEEKLSPRSGYLVEVAYAVIGIDTTTGHSLGLIRSPQSYIQSKGGLRLPASIDSKYSLTDQFRALAQSATNNGGNRSLFAIPLPYFLGDGQGYNYMPYVVVLGARAIVKVESGVAEYLLSSAGNEPVVGDVRIKVLRSNL